MSPKQGVDRELEAWADRLLIEAALDEPQSPTNESRGRRKYAGPALRRQGILTPGQEDDPAVVFYLDEAQSLPDGEHHTSGRHTKWDQSPISLEETRQEH